MINPQLPNNNQAEVPKIRGTPATLLFLNINSFMVFIYIHQ